MTKQSQHLAKPVLMHLEAANHVLKYLKGTKNRNLVFGKTEEGLNLTVFVTQTGEHPV